MAMSQCFIGLGQMGRRMARRLDPEHTFVFNRSRQPVEELRLEGYQTGLKLETMVAQSDVVFTMLTDHHVVSMLSSTILSNLTPGALWIDFSTGNPAASEALELSCEQHKVQFVAAPVSGSTKPAETGELVVLMGGSPASQKRAAQVLKPFGSVVPVGSVAQALELKLAINALLAFYVTGVGEALQMVDRAGVPRETFLDVVGQSALSAPILKGKAPMWKQKQYPAQFSVDLMAKDLELAIEWADNHQLGAAGMRALHDLFKQAQHDGLGDWDMAGIGDAENSMLKS